MTSEFYGSQVQGSAGFSASGLMRYKSTCWLCRFFLRDSGEEFAYKLIWVAARIQFLASIALMFPFPHSPQSPHSSSRDPSSKQQWYVTFQISDFASYLLLLPFERLRHLDQAHPDSLHFKVR